MSASALFPAFLDLRGRPCLVVGAGEVAQQKVTSLIASGAAVHVVAPHASAEIQHLGADHRLRWSPRAFLPSDLDGVFLVVAATSDVQVNEKVFREADSRGVLCNAVDDPEHCHFQYPAVVRRGDLQIAISTGGRSPALAQRLRTELEAQFGVEYGPWLEWLGTVRELLFRRRIDPEQRKLALHRIVRRDVFNRFVSARRRRQGGSTNG